MAERLEIPIGKPEGPTLEFKAAAALRNPDKIGREVVGLLNADGGDVWIGITERDGHAVQIDPIGDPGRARRALLDHLIATIEPAPVGEIEIDVVPRGTNAFVLRVHVEKPRHVDRTYSSRIRDLRYFGVRVADRLRTMSSDEIFARSDTDDVARQRWTKATDAVQRELAKKEKTQLPLLWLCLHPVAESLNLKFDTSTHLLFTDPSATGNRATGWTFVNRLAPVDQESASRLVHGGSGGPTTQVTRRGQIVFSAPLGLLYWKGELQLIWPYILIELTVSIFRLARALYRERAVPKPEDDRVAAQIALIGARGWKLKSGSVRSFQWELEKSSVLTKPSAISELRDPRLRQIDDHPDLCARPLIEDLYQEFGLERDDVPVEFDPIQGLQLGS